MTELLDSLASWHALLFALVIFGFAPGLVLRVLVLLYPRGASRRRELIAELYGIARWERPFWVAQQFEVVLCESVLPRCHDWCARPAFGRWLQQTMFSVLLASVAGLLDLALIGLCRIVGIAQVVSAVVAAVSLLALGSALRVRRSPGQAAPMLAFLFMLIYLGVGISAAVWIGLFGALLSVNAPNIALFATTLGTGVLLSCGISSVGALASRRGRARATHA